MSVKNSQVGEGMGGAVGGPAAGGVSGGGGKSWAALLSSNLPSAWNKNILEVVLEKDERGSFNVSESDCARVMKKLGLDQRPGIHVESVQICPNGRGVLLITLKKEVSIERFCRHDVFVVTESGIRAINVKPAGKREVVVTMKGIHPNTRDDGVLDYLSKYGKVVTSKVIYGVFGEGPLKGIRNGDRSYKVEIKPSTNLGTYHVIDGQKVTARYSGQQQTCARCFGTPLNCPGKGMARRCELENGPKVDFTDYIYQLWDKIGYRPAEVELNSDINEDHANQNVGQQFTPVKGPEEHNDKFAGVCVKQFPKDTDHGEIVEFLINSGLAETHKESIMIKTNGTVMINNLQSSECQVLITAIHNKTSFGRRLYCNGIIPLTPDKPDQQPPISLPNTVQPPTPLSPLSPNTFSQDINTIGARSIIPDTPDVLHMQLSNDQLVRRHSLSLRSPPAGSVAEEILGTATANQVHHYAKARTILSGLKEMSERFLTQSDLSSSGTDSDDRGYKVQKIKNKKSAKHRLSVSPKSESCVKKQNTAASPHQ